ncbi:MAG: condensation domain-containing protein, partial [Rhodococcus sp. (in: high G+C Gram-positive bacteria)]
MSAALPLTSGQRAIWVAQQLSPDVPFVIAFCTEVDGSVELDTLTSAYQRALRELCGGNMRVAHPHAGGEPYCVVDDAAVPVTVVDLRDHECPDEAAQMWMQREHRSASALHGDLVVSAVLHVGENRWLWYARAHHLVLDGYAAMMLITRAAELYEAALSGRQPPPPDHADAAAAALEDRRYQESSRRSRDRDFWAEQTTDLPDPVSLGRGPPL